MRQRHTAHYMMVCLSTVLSNYSKNPPDIFKFLRFYAKEDSLYRTFSGRMFQNWETRTVKDVWPKDVFLLRTIMSPIILYLVNLDKVII